MTAQDKPFVSLSFRDRCDEPKCLRKLGHSGFCWPQPEQDSRKEAGL